MPTQTIRILGISGSLRQSSCSTGMLRYVSSNIKRIKPPTKDTKIDFTTADISKLPLFNEDIMMSANEHHQESIISNITAFRNQIKNADAILFSIPEYNFGMTAAFKNAIDWGSYDGSASKESGNTWKGKAGGIISVGGGVGGLRAQQALRQSAVALDLHLVGAPEVCVPRYAMQTHRYKVGNPFDDKTGDFVDPTTQKWVLGLTQRLVALHIQITSKDSNQT